MTQCVRHCTNMSQLHSLPLLRDRHSFCDQNWDCAEVTAKLDKGGVLILKGDD